jgi:hypothetical protein
MGVAYTMSEISLTLPNLSTAAAAAASGIPFCSLDLEVRRQGRMNLSIPPCYDRLSSQGACSTPVADVGGLP